VKALDRYAAPDADFVLVAAESHSGPGRAKRAKKTLLNESSALPGYRGQSAWLVYLCAAGALAGGLLVSAQQRLPSEPARQFGTSITGAFEGWFANPDGSRFFLVGYLNRNFAQAMDVPIGANNRIEPGGPDMGQPTHFLPGRQWGMFLVPVPKDFTAKDKLTWTLVANGQPTSIPFRLHPDYVVSPFRNVAAKNTPPVLRFEQRASSFQGPTANVANAIPRTIASGTLLPLTVWATDDATYSSGSNAPMRNPPPAVTLVWSKYRGPGQVTFDKTNPPFDKDTAGEDAAFSGKATTTARFSEPGEYMLHVTANDYSGNGGGGEVCCWTTAIVKVSVTGTATSTVRDAR
jgi:hypothetical protein